MTTVLVVAVPAMSETVCVVEPSASMTVTPVRVRSKVPSPLRSVCVV